MVNVVMIPDIYIYEVSPATVPSKERGDSRDGNHCASRGFNRILFAGLGSAGIIVGTLSLFASAPSVGGCSQWFSITV